MRRAIFVFAFLILLVIAWRLSGRPRETPLAAEPEAMIASEPRPTPAARVAPVVPVAKHAAPPISSASSLGGSSGFVPKPPAKRSGRPAPPPPSAVPYELENGLAIGYGDIVLGQPANPEVPEEGFTKVEPIRLWPTRTIAYAISPKLKDPSRILAAIEVFHEKTPIRFVAFSGEANAIAFEPAEKYCRSYLGQIGGHQPIFLSDGCGKGEILHEMMHALGFVHEQSRPDRDQFVRILWDQIEDDKKEQFQVVPQEWAGPIFGRPFDYQSVMLYSTDIFAKTRGVPTFESLTRDAIEPTQGALSREDVDRVYRTYGHVDL